MKFCSTSFEDGFQTVKILSLSEVHTKERKN
jgi:hypothetical protein